MKALVLLLSLFSCHRVTTTRADCERVVARFVELELHEQGFRDAALAQQKVAELQQKLAPQIDRCVGQHVRPDLIECIRSATSSEEINHQCLR